MQFYRDVVGLKPLTNYLPKHVFEFGAGQLWIDRVDGMSQAEIWLELVVDDVPAASEHLGLNEIIRRDEIGPLPEGFDGFWISNPASIIHLVSKRNQFWT